MHDVANRNAGADKRRQWIRRDIRRLLSLLMPMKLFVVFCSCAAVRADPIALPDGKPASASTTSATRRGWARARARGAKRQPRARHPATKQATAIGVLEVEESSTAGTTTA